MRHGGSPVSDAQWAALGALLTAVILKLTDWIQSRSGQVTKQRKDLLSEVRELWARNDKLEKEVEEWRNKYFTLQDTKEKNGG